MDPACVGAVIAVASRGVARPLLQVGGVSAIKRIVLTFRQAGVFPIVIVTGAEEHEVRAQLSSSGVVFLSGEGCTTSNPFEFAQVGMRFLRDKCERMFVTPVGVPMFTPDTVHSLLRCDDSVVAPSFCGRGGHPLLVSSDVVDRLLPYDGGGGLRAALLDAQLKRTWIDVQDEGVLSNVRDAAGLDRHVGTHDRALLAPHVRLGIAKERVFFESRAKLLLYLIQRSHSVKQSGRLMALSNSKAWSIINVLEEELGYAVVDRRRGGAGGGTTTLTPKGRAFLQAYFEFERNVIAYAQGEFEKLFIASSHV